MHARYRKHNDHSHSSSTYHKKDGTNVRAKLKIESSEEIGETLYEGVSENTIGDRNGIGKFQEAKAHTQNVEVGQG